MVDAGGTRNVGTHQFLVSDFCLSTMHFPISNNDTERNGPMTRFIHLFYKGLHYGCHDIVKRMHN